MVALNPGTKAEVDPGKQRRKASGIPVVTVIDGFRTCGVLGVVMLHIVIICGFLPYQNDAFRGLLAWGILGQALDMLFIISGFVLFLPTAARSGAFGSRAAYAIRRWARLFPAYWTVILLMLILLATVTVTPELPFPSGFDIFLHLTTLEVPAEMFRNVFFLGFGINRALWTLSSEVIFYLLLPFIAAWYFRHPFLGLVAAGAITSAWKLVFVNLAGVSDALGLGFSQTTIDRLFIASEIQFPGWAFSFAVGMTAAWLFVELRRRYKLEDLLRPARITLVVAGVILLVFIYLAGSISRNAPFLLAHEYARHSPFMALGFSLSLGAVMLAIMFCGRRIQRPFSNRPMTWLADNSFGIYMMHLVFISYAAYLLDLPRDGSIRAVVIWSALILPASILYGFISARLIERPIRRKGQIWARRASGH